MAQASFTNTRRDFLRARGGGCEAEPVAGILLGKKERRIPKKEKSAL